MTKRTLPKFEGEDVGFPEPSPWRVGARIRWVASTTRYVMQNHIYTIAAVRELGDEDISIYEARLQIDLESVDGPDREARDARLCFGVTGFRPVRSRRTRRG